jgi:hypothetical protein
VHWQTVLIGAWLRALDNTPTAALKWWQRHRAKPDRRYIQAKVKDSTRHWFEVSHWLYLKALEQALNELENSR